MKRYDSTHCSIQRVTPFVKKIRTFVAVELSPEICKRAADLIERLRMAGAKVSWVKPDSMHITLKFLGDVPNVETPEVCSAVARAAARSEPFDLECFGAGAFPDAQRARTVWLGAREGSEAIIALHDAIDAELHKAGYPKEARRFHPHLTLGRVRSGGREQQMLAELIEQNAKFEAGDATIDEVVVVASFLDKAGPTYEIMSRSPLGE